MRIAYLEDDPDQAALVTRWLRAAGHECTHFTAGNALLDALAEPLPDLLLLDWHVPDTTGEAVMRAVRTRFAQPPGFIFLTAHDEGADLSRVLGAGAAEHIRKPVARAELLARIGAFAATAATPIDDGALSFAAYEFDDVARTVSLREQPLKLDDTEFAVALCLFRNAGQTVSFSALAELAMRSGGGEASPRSAQACVARVRAKLRLTAATGWQLRTVTGVGFRLEAVR